MRTGPPRRPTSQALPREPSSPDPRLEAPDHDKSYLRNTLWFLAVVSAGAFVLVLRERPKKADLDTP